MSLLRRLRGSDTVVLVANPDAREAPPIDIPPIRCPKHLNDPTPPNCGRCADFRRAHDEAMSRLGQQQEAERTGTAQARRDLITHCQNCDENGWRSDTSDRAIKCDHGQAASA